MKWKLFALLAALSLPTLPASAADQNVDLSSTMASFLGTAPLLDGGSDVITLTNLAAGTYDFLLSISSQNIPDLAAEVNGQPAEILATGVFRFASLDSTGDSPFVLTIFGTAGPRSLYSGEFQVTLVPEPGTLVLVLAGLGLVATKARARA